MSNKNNSLPKHTKLPWLIKLKDERGFYISGGDVKTVAIARNASEGNFFPRPRIAKINAEFIVNACNSHYQLVEALRTAKATIMVLSSELNLDKNSLSARSVLLNLEEIDDALLLVKGKS